MRSRKWFEMNRGKLVLLLATGLVGVCFGVDTASSKGGVIHAKISITARDPFWPVGYEPEKPENVEVMKLQTLADKNWNEAMKQVVIQGVSRVSGEYCAIINTKTKRVGESVSVEYGGVRYTWRVDGITPPGSVKLRRVSAE
jgi:hypothetical protein